MAQRRMIWAQLASNKVFAKMSDKAQKLYVFMIVLADDEGRLKGDSELLRANIFPYETESISIEMMRKLIKEVANAKLITWYKQGKEYFIQHPNWTKYQILRADRTKPSDIPLPDDNQMTTKRPRNISKDNISKDKRIHIRENASKKEESTPNPDVKKLFDFFHRATKGIRGHDPVKENGEKIGKLLKKRLESDKIAPERIERMIVWYLTRKKRYKDEKNAWHETYKNAPEMGVMLSDAFFSQLLSDESNALTYMADNYANLEKVFNKAGGAVYSHEKDDILQAIKDLAMSKRQVVNNSED